MKPRLLLVEDDPTSLAFLQAASRETGAEVDAAASIASAFALASHGGHALWLIDANLPDGSGADLLARLRARGLATPALAHTADGGAATRAALLAAGFADVLVKPLPAEHWQAALRRHLGQRIAEPQGPAQPAAATATGALPVWDELRALSALKGNAGHVDALRRLFLDELPAATAAAADAFAAGDRDAMHAALHRLRASCAFVGASRLEAAVQALEASGSDPALADFLAAAQETASSRPG